MNLPGVGNDLGASRKSTDTVFGDFIGESIIMNHYVHSQVCQIWTDLTQELSHKYIDVLGVEREIE